MKIHAKNNQEDVNLADKSSVNVNSIQNEFVDNSSDAIEAQKLQAAADNSPDAIEAPKITKYCPSIFIERN